MKISALSFAVFGSFLALAADSPTLLRPGPGIERELRGGETQEFLIPARAGQFIHAAVEQQGIDAVVRLLAPGGAEGALSDFPNSDLGPEVVAVIAEATGEYTPRVAAA